MDDSLDTHQQRWRILAQRLRAQAQRLIPFAGGVAAALAALLIYHALFPAQAPLTARDVDESIAAAMASATPPPAFSSQVYQIIAPSLVLIQSTGPLEEGEHEHSLGSGVIIKDTGEVMTALHVVDAAEEILLTFADGTETTAQVLEAQPDNDIAVLMPDALPGVVAPAVLGNPNAMRIGDEAFAVGNPFGLYGSMSTGVISGFNRTFHNPDTDIDLQGLLQIDAAVNPGNSGGPLLNRYGQVIGIVVGIVNPTGQEVFIGIGFAMPITTAASGGGGALPY